MADVQIDIKYVAHLARLELTAAEQQKFGDQLGHILEHIEKLKQLDVTDVEPTAHAAPRVNVTRAVTSPTGSSTLADTVVSCAPSRLFT